MSSFFNIEETIFLDIPSFSYMYKSWRICILYRFIYVHSFFLYTHIRLYFVFILRAMYYTCTYKNTTCVYLYISLYIRVSCSFRNTKTCLSIRKRLSVTHSTDDRHINAWFGSYLTEIDGRAMHLVEVVVIPQWPKFVMVYIYVETTTGNNSLSKVTVNSLSIATRTICLSFEVDLCV